MKIETKKQEFQPVVITLESQEEVDMLGDVISVVFNNASSDVVHGTVEWKVMEFLREMEVKFDPLVSDNEILTYFQAPVDYINFK